MREINSKVVGGLVCAALAGCGSVQGKTGTPIETAPMEIAQAVCPKAYDCCTTAQLMGNAQAGTTEAECETKTVDAYSSQIEAVKQSEQAGRAAYDGDKLAACLNTVRSSSCDALRMTNHLRGVPGCDSFVQPKVEVGGACGNDWECVQGWCQPMMSDSSSNDGTCQIPQDGDDCIGDNHDQCAPGFACDATTTKCHALGAQGATCSTNADCQSANCNAASGQVGTCDPPAGTCFYASACSVGGDPRPSLLGILGALGLAGALGARRRRRRRRA
jgi:MYXO-CTERM domain-containing protein